MAEESVVVDQAGEEAFENETGAAEGYVPPTVELVESSAINSSVSLMSSGGGGGGGGGSTGGGITLPAEGTEIRPYVLTEGVSKTVRSSGYWFKCTASGSVNFKVTTTANVIAKFYLGNRSGTKTLLVQRAGNGSLTHKTDEKGPSTYYVNCTADSTISVTCLVEENEDVNTSYPSRTEWCASDGSGYALPTYQYMYRRFLSRSQTEDLVDALEDDAFDIVGSYLEGEISSAGLEKAANQLGIAISKINAVLQAFSGYVEGVNLINNLDMRLTLKYESGFTKTGSVTNGVMVDVYDDGWNGPYADILAWTSGKMTGPVGSRGYFRAPNYDQIDDFVSGEV